jgi:hypothetical protein
MYTANEQAGMAGWTQAARDAYLPRIPVGRMGTGEDIGHAVVFLCSSSASYITGATLSVDGGYTTALDLQVGLGRIVVCNAMHPLHITDLQKNSVPLFLKRQCDGTVPAADGGPAELRRSSAAQ